MKIEFEDLREWLIKVNQMGELKRAKGIKLENVGKIAETTVHLENTPALLLEEFPGYDPGFRILLNVFGSIQRIALTFGFPIHSDRVTLVKHFQKKLDEMELLPPKYVSSGPIFENRLTGENVNLYQFPVPKWHPEDGGPYIGTGCMVITRDPEDGWVNVGTYRNQLHDEKTIGFYISPGHHGWVHRKKYFENDEPCPVAVVFGSDPLLFAGSMIEFPWGVCEFDGIGGWRGESVKVVKGSVTGLPIPANAEIAIEGYSYPDKKKEEGPFGEWTGYYGSSLREEPYIEVEAVYFRDNPILLGMPPQKPPYDADKAREYIKSALLFNELKKLGIPGIINAWCFGIGGCRLLIAVSIKQQYPGHSRQVGHAVYSTPMANYLGRYVIVVDEDINVTDLNEVMWAVLTRSDPATSIDIITRATSGPLDPILSPENKKMGRFYNSRAIIDATKPYEWKEKFPKSLNQTSNSKTSENITDG
jgi:4-hydroxy-3-polyprenylbenzoate decarboxylase